MKLDGKQVLVVLGLIRKVMKLYRDDQRGGDYPRDCNDFLNQFSRQDFQVMGEILKSYHIRK